MTKWQSIAIDTIVQCGFNTIGNWSHQDTARRSKMPWVLPLKGEIGEDIPRVFRDMPDVFHQDFNHACDNYAAQLTPYLADQHLIGYFLLNCSGASQNGWPRAC